VVGIELKDFTNRIVIDAVKEIINMANNEEVRKRCVEVESKYFALSGGVKSYNRIYDDLTRK